MVITACGGCVGERVGWGGGCGDGEGKVKGNQHNDQNLGTELSKTMCTEGK